MGFEYFLFVENVIFQTHSILTGTPQGTNFRMYEQSEEPTGNNIVPNNM